MASPLVTTGPAAGQEDARPDLPRGRDGRRRRGRAVAVDARPARRLRRGREAALRQHLVLVVPRRAGARPGRDEADAGAAAEEDTTGPPGHDDDADRPAWLSSPPRDRLGEPVRHPRRPERSRRRRRGASSRPRRAARRHAPPSTRSGSGRRAGRRSARGSAAGRRSAPARGSGRRPRS